MKRKGISYTMTIAVTGMVLLIGAVTVTALFTDTLGGTGDILERWIGGADEKFCRERVTSFCDDNPGANWIEEYPKCEKYKESISGGSEMCSDVESSGSAGDTQDSGSSGDDVTAPPGVQPVS